MKFYKDLAHKEEITESKIEFPVIDAGDTRKHTIYLQNDSKAELMDIKFEISDKEHEIKILKAPEFMKESGDGELVIEITAKVDVEAKVSGILSYKANKIFR
jgi:hypothetical protein